MNILLAAELARIIADGGEPPADLPGVTIPELFEFSGLTRKAWCEALGISDSRWSQLRSGTVNIPRWIRKKAIVIAFATAAARTQGFGLLKNAPKGQEGEK